MSWRISFFRQFFFILKINLKNYFTFVLQKSIMKIQLRNGKDLTGKG